MLAENIIKKHLLIKQPDYLDAFDAVLNSMTLYRCNMFVTRREIFDAYCAWLFSFLLDATKEIFQTVQLSDFPDSRRRVMGYFSERMLMTWLFRNRLRLRELKIMEAENL